MTLVCHPLWFSVRGPGFIPTFHTEHQQNQIPSLLPGASASFCGGTPHSSQDGFTHAGSTVFFALMSSSGRPKGIPNKYHQWRPCDRLGQGNRWAPLVVVACFARISCAPFAMWV